MTALKRIYGLEVDAKTRQPTADARENQAALAALGRKGLRLHSDDDWRQFAKAKFEQNLSATKRADLALDSVIDLLKVYLKAFTVHSPMNIDDFGDNLLTLTFPRALTGQLVHDCGVYALRIAYILSLIRDHPSLKLRLSYIQLPVHVGLIVTGSGLPAYLIHNDTFTRYDPAELTRLRKVWDTLDEKGEQRTKPAAASAKNDEQFLAELAAMEFVPNTDMPFIVTNVPKLGGTSGAADRALLWRSYQGIVRNELFGPPSRDPKDPAYQFHLRYLEVLEDMKSAPQHIRRALLERRGASGMGCVPPRPRASRDGDRCCEGSCHQKEGRGSVRCRSGQVPLAKRGRVSSVETAFKDVRDKFGPIRTKTDKIVHELQTHPKIVAPRAGQASGDRQQATFKELAQPLWARESIEHFSNIGLRSVTPPPAFGDRKNQMDIVD